jgi:transcription elongation factor S-II
MEVTQKLRDESIKKISKIFAKKPKKKEKELATKMEKSIYDFSYDYAENNNTPFLFQNIYETKVDEIICTLESDTTKSVVKALVSGKIDASKIAILKPEELNPEKYEKILKKKEIEEFKKKNKATSNAFKCSKCKKRKCEVVEKQIRAGDEPATVFVTCLECGHKFSF